MLFIGTEISEKDAKQLPPHDVVQAFIGEESKWFRRLKEGDSVKGDHLEGTDVKAGELLALVDDTSDDDGRHGQHCANGPNRIAEEVEVERNQDADRARRPGQGAEDDVLAEQRAAHS